MLIFLPLTPPATCYVRFWHFSIPSFSILPKKSKSAGAGPMKLLVTVSHFCYRVTFSSPCHISVTVSHFHHFSHSLHGFSHSLQGFSHSLDGFLIFYEMRASQVYFCFCFFLLFLKFSYVVPYCRVGSSLPAW